MPSPNITIRRAAVAAAVAALVSPTTAHSEVLATDFVLPIWQGTPTSPPAAGHQLDCTSANVAWPSGCTFTMNTVTNGANCRSEVVGNPTVGVINTYSNTPCILQLSGTVTFTQSQVCLYQPDVMYIRSWQSGVSSTLFSVSMYPVRAVMAPVTAAGGSLSPNLYKLTVTTAGTVFMGHTITMKELFYVNFTRRTTACPDVDGPTNLKANVYDRFADTVPSGANGFFKDTVAV